MKPATSPPAHTFPWSDASAAHLALALVEPSPSKREQLFAAACAADASLAEWLNARVLSVDGIERICQWLAEHVALVTKWCYDAGQNLPSGDTPATWQKTLPELCGKLLRLAQLEEDFDRRLHTAKLDAVKELAYGAGHEINNPLANISTRAQTLLRDEPHPERRRMLATINRQAFRAYEMIADLMLFARPSAPSPEPVDLVELADRVVHELSQECAERAVTLTRQHVEGRVTIEVDPTQLAVALRALCMNALEAIGSGGAIDLSVRPTAGGAAIIVSDNGPGMDERQLAHLFDPFFSGREAGRGLGLGLSKCWQIIKAHAGEIVVESQPGRGATFTVTLPGIFASSAVH